MPSAAFAPLVPFLYSGPLPAALLILATATAASAAFCASRAVDSLAVRDLASFWASNNEVVAVLVSLLSLLLSDARR